MRRKSIARRRPVVVYRVESDPEDASIVRVRAWEAEDDETKRLNRDRPFGSGWVDEQGAIRGQWLDSTDTDGIHALPEDVRELIWEMDDSIRAALKK